MTAPVTAPAEPTAPAPVNAMQAAIDARRAELSTASLAEPPAETLEPQTEPETPEPVEGEQPETPEPEPALDTIDLPGRRPGEEDLGIAVDDPVVADRLRQMVNGYERKMESQARFEQANAMIQEAREFQTQVQIDPMGVVQQTLDPQRQAHLALRLVAQNLQTLGPILQDVLANPAQMEVLNATLEAESYRLKEQAQQEIQATRQAERNAADITTGIDALIPTTLNGAQRQIWRQDALVAVREYVRQHNIQVLHPMDLPLVLASRLRAFGVPPENASALLHQTFTRSAVPTAPVARPSEPNGEQLRKAATARRAAGQAAPTGAGAPTAQLPKVPPKAGVSEAINAIRAQRGMRQR